MPELPFDGNARIVSELGAYAAAIASAKDLDALIMAVESIIDVFVKSEYTGLYLFDPDSEKLRLYFARGFSESERLAAEASAMDRHPGKVFRTKKVLNIPDVETDPSRESSDSPRSFTVGSRLYVPILARDECVGTFGIVSSQKHRFGTDELTIFDFICKLAGIAYRNLLEEKRRLKVERQLLLKERAIAGSSNGIIITDATLPDNPVIYVNQGFEAITRYQSHEILGKNCRFLQGDDKHQEGLITLRKALTEKTACTVILKNFRKDGSLFLSELSITPVFNDEGLLTNYIGIQNDVTERISAEKTLSLMNERITQLIQSLPSGVLLEDQQRKVALINKEFCTMFGIPLEPEALIGGDCAQAAENSKVLFADEQGFIENIAETLQNKIIVKNHVLPLKDGRIFERDYVPIFMKQEYLGHLWNYRDITQQKEFEREIAQLKQFYEHTLHELPGQIAVFDNAFKYLYVNPGSVRDPMIREWIIGKDDHEYCRFRNLDASIADKRKAHLIQVRESKQTVRFEEDIERPDGTILHFERFISPILDSSGTIQRYLAYGIDLTEVKSLIKKLEFSNKSLTQFAYIASHDLREPLRKISAFGSLLSRSLAAKLNEDEKENLDFMIDGAKRMQLMVDDLLIFSRISTTPGQLNELSLDTILHEIISFDLAEAIREKHARVIIEKPFGAFKAEYTHMKQLLQNLIANAIKYSHPGRDPIVKLRSAQKGGYRIIEVEDNGIGIAADYKEQIFEMFKRLHGSDRFSGSGIGLAVCKKIAENYGGDISVYSQLGQGSTFIIRLQR